MQIFRNSGEILWKKFDTLSVVVSEEDIKLKAVPVKGNKVLLVTIGGDKGVKFQTHKLQRKTVYKIGRDRSNQIVVEDERVSRSHLKIEVTADDRVIATDMGSSRGTKVNGERITSVALREEDRIEIGNAVCTLQVK